MQKYDKALYYEIFESGEYAFLDSFFSESKIIVDVGGHKGFFSLYAFSKGFSGKIYFFEPIEENFKEAQKNLENFKSHIYFYNKGISNKDYIGEMYYNSEKTMQSSVFNHSFLCNSGEKREREFINISNFFEEKNFSKFVDILKIDIEGYEFELLENIDERFLKKVQILVIEYHEIFDDENKKKEKIIQKLEKYFSSSQIFPSRYTPKVGIIFAKK
ncbi:FkbM family methyltransferase [Candidatus Gracilibacteria bacterium]|nr:FkbM family methyltransferase [Candidatus Gracilibacteria bacterium]NUJ98353.1 FkbM family methyltransferase [Candidatus Gracilibacteria bacterium]NUJ99292.1 FkbM family methyltransferase [Candidatus Gracilibacteria bacterium]